MLVAALAAFCCAVAGYFCWVTLGFSISLTNAPLTAQWLTPFSIAKPASVGLFVLSAFCYLIVKYNAFSQKSSNLSAFFRSLQRLLPRSKRLLMSVILSLIVGLLWSVSAHNHFIQSRVQAPQTVEVLGMIVGLPESRGSDVTFHFRTKNGENIAERFQGILLRVTWRNPKTDLEPGQIWRLPLHFKRRDGTGKWNEVQKIVASDRDEFDFSLDKLAGEFKSGGLDEYFHYDGGLTTPTCDEVVNWHVLKTPLSMSKV